MKAKLTGFPDWMDIIDEREGEREREREREKEREGEESRMTTRY